MGIFGFYSSKFFFSVSFCSSKSSMISCSPLSNLSLTSFFKSENWLLTSVNPKNSCTGFRYSTSAFFRAPGSSS